MVISKITKSLSVFVSAAILLMASTVTGAADKKLTAPIADWTGGAVTCKVLEVILEQEMGYEIKRIMMPSGAGVYEAMAVGDLDFGCESWPSYSPSRNRFMTEFGGMEPCPTSARPELSVLPPTMFRDISWTRPHLISNPGSS